MSDESSWPLAGLRVLDLSTEIAGPYCTKLWVDAGAEVLKVELPGGDALRRWTASGQLLDEAEDGALFQYLNASKRSAVIDWRTAEGREHLLDLASRADLLVESAGPGVLAAAGISWESLQERNPSLSLVSISPWGQEGPWADRPCSEFTLQAAVGSVAYRGLRDRKPVAAGGRLGEWAAGVFAAVGGLSAWMSGRGGGRGQQVDVSMFEAVLLSMTVYHDLNAQWVEGLLPRAVEIPSIEPAKDGWIGFCAITGQQWTDFCSMIGQQEVGQDQRYLDGRMRMESIEYMREIIHPWTQARTADEMQELALLLRIPVSKVGNGKLLPEMDHFAERGVFIDNPGGFLQPRPFCRLGRGEQRPLGSAPGLGEHTDEVLRELRDAVVSSQPKASADEPSLPLSGLRVVDLTNFWAGPIATCWLADMGADVIKVESIQRPDGMRFAGAIRNEVMWEWSPVFHGANPGKRDITLRLDSDEGIALIKKLVAQADIVLENFSARVAGVSATPDGLARAGDIPATPGG